MTAIYGISASIGNTVNNSVTRVPILLNNVRSFKTGVIVLNGCSISIRSNDSIETIINKINKAQNRTGVRAWLAKQNSLYTLILETKRPEINIIDNNHILLHFYKTKKLGTNNSCFVQGLHSYSTRPAKINYNCSGVVKMQNLQDLTILNEVSKEELSVSDKEIHKEEELEEKAAALEQKQILPIKQKISVHKLIKRSLNQSNVENQRGCIILNLRLNETNKFHGYLAQRRVLSEHKGDLQNSLSHLKMRFDITTLCDSNDVLNGLNDTHNKLQESNLSESTDCNQVNEDNNYYVGQQMKSPNESFISSNQSSLQITLEGPKLLNKVNEDNMTSWPNHSKPKGKYKKSANNIIKDKLNEAEFLSAKKQLQEITDDKEEAIKRLKELLRQIKETKFDIERQKEQLNKLLFQFNNFSIEHRNKLFVKNKHEQKGDKQMVESIIQTIFDLERKISATKQEVESSDHILDNLQNSLKHLQDEEISFNKKITKYSNEILKLNAIYKENPLYQDNNKKNQTRENTINTKHRRYI
jgi:hypothetical protein